MTANPDLPSRFEEAYLRRRLQEQTRPLKAFAWDLETIRSVRDEHTRGTFRRSAALAEASKCGSAVYSALLNRIAPHRGLPRTIVAPPNRRRLETEARRTFAPGGSVLTTGLLADIFERLAMLGMCVCQNVWTAREDGSRIDVRLEIWPMHAVRWDPHRKKLMARTTRGEVEIVHGDGKWVVFQLHGHEPWEWGAIKPLCLIWADREYGRRDRSLNSETHGQAKMIGTPPDREWETDTKEGKDFAELVQNLQLGQSGGVKPHGSTIELLESLSRNFEVFDSIINGCTKETDRILLGQDGTLTNEGGNYIKAAQLHNVRYDIVEGDLTAVQEGINVGTFRPWTGVNFGEPDDAPQIKWLLPDPEEDTRRESLGKRTDAFNRALGDYRKNGFIIDQKFADELAGEFGVRAPKLGDVPEPEPEEQAA